MSQYRKIEISFGFMSAFLLNVSLILFGICMEGKVCAVFYALLICSAYSNQEYFNCNRLNVEYCVLTFVWCRNSSVGKKWYEFFTEIFVLNPLKFCQTVSKGKNRGSC